MIGQLMELNLSSKWKGKTKANEKEVHLLNVSGSE